MTVMQKLWDTFHAAGWLILLCVMLTGCGSEFARVTGTVRMDGELLRGGDKVRGTVFFYPEESTGAPAVGTLDDAGEYSLTTGSNQGARPGPYKVTIRATELVPSKIEGIPPSGRPISSMEYADPRRSPFRVEVEKGGNELDFDIKSAPKRQPRRRR